VTTASHDAATLSTECNGRAVGSADPPRPARAAGRGGWPRACASAERKCSVRFCGP